VSQLLDMQVDISMSMRMELLKRETLLLIREVHTKFTGSPPPVSEME
jgi:hypothetical protein